MTAVSTPLAENGRISASNTEALMVRKAQVFVHHAIDRYLGACARRNLAESTRQKYRKVLDPFGDTVSHKTVAEIAPDDCNTYLDRYADHSSSTQALYVTIIRRFFEWCEDEGLVKTSPAAKLKRPRRPRPEDVEVVTVSSDEVRRMLAACVDWQERLCIAVVFYMGVRRSAAATVRRRDADLDTGYIRFREKGNKLITKPIPDELLALLRRADELGQWLAPDEYLIPNRKPWLVDREKRGRRGTKVIYETVVRVAERACVRSHVHALRAAFAVEFDAENPGNTALQELLGHASYDTTKRHYLRRRDVKAAMEPVRKLTLFPASAVTPPAGFEPAFPPSELVEPTQTVTGDASLPDALLERARSKAKSEEQPRRVDLEDDAVSDRGD